MTPEQKELLRLAILQTLEANRTRYGMTLVHLGFNLGIYGFTMSQFGGAGKFYEALADELQYLTDKGLMEEVQKTVSKENRAWRISAAGIAFVDRQP